MAKFIIYRNAFKPSLGLDLPVFTCTFKKMFRYPYFLKTSIIDILKGSWREKGNRAP